MTGGTENSASTKMSKVLGVNPNPDDAEEGEEAAASASDVPAKSAGMEGTKKALESMFTAMAPLKGNKKRDSDSEGEDTGKSKRKRTTKQTPEPGDEPDPDDEALRVPLLVQDFV